MTGCDRMLVPGAGPKALGRHSALGKPALVPMALSRVPKPLISADKQPNWPCAPPRVRARFRKMHWPSVWFRG